MNPDLSARIALITGASSGMGRDYARELASRGVSLVLVALRTEPLEQLAQELRGRFSAATHAAPPISPSKGISMHENLPPTLKREDVSAPQYLLPAELDFYQGYSWC